MLIGWSIDWSVVLSVGSSIERRKSRGGDVSAPTSSYNSTAVQPGCNTTAVQRITARGAARQTRDGGTVYSSATTACSFFLISPSAAFADANILRTCTYNGSTFTSSSPVGSPSLCEIARASHCHTARPCHGESRPGRPDGVPGPTAATPAWYSSSMCDTTIL